MPVSLLLLFGLAFIMGAGLVVMLVHAARGDRTRGQAPRQALITQASFAHPGAPYFPRPACWLALKTCNLLAVQAALGLHHPKPCSWAEGFADEEKLFIAPPLKGWILVIGSRLPDPADDVDACFRFVLALSHKLGEVQFFSASPILHHHAWVRAEHGRIIRAYAWAGRTIWNQGPRTPAEKQLHLKCFEYADPVQSTSFGQSEAIAVNVDKLPQLAARWSLDPAAIDEHFLYHEQGIAGEPSRRY